MIFVQPYKCFHKRVNGSFTEEVYVVIFPNGKVGICEKKELGSFIGDTSNATPRFLPDIPITPSVLKELVRTYAVNGFVVSRTLTVTYNVADYKKKMHL